MALFRGRVLGFDERAALVWDHLMSQGTAAGRPRNALDTVVAAIAKAHDCEIVSANEKHFPGADLSIHFGQENRAAGSTRLPIQYPFRLRR
jgi:predicted nucleic acid-binding protein